MRKYGLYTILLMVFVLLLSACGGQSNKKEQSAVDASASKTRTIETVKGPVEVPFKPQTIFINYYQGDLLALGVKAAAVRNTNPGAAFEEELSDAKNLSYDLNPEEVMAVSPDLIIVNEEELYNSLKDIAPTVFIDEMNLTAEERLRFIAQVVGKEAEAEKAIEGFQQTLADSKQKLSEAGILDKTISTMVLGENEFWVYGEKWGMGGDMIYTHFGMNAPEPIKKDVIGSEQQWKEVSMEVLPDYVGDFVLVGLKPGEKNPVEDRDVWKKLPVVAEDNVIYYPEGLFYYNDFYSLTKQFEFITNELLERN